MNKGDILGYTVKSKMPWDKDKNCFFIHNEWFEVYAMFSDFLSVTPVVYWRVKEIK